MQIYVKSGNGRCYPIFEKRLHINLKYYRSFVQYVSKEKNAYIYLSEMWRNFKKMFSDIFFKYVKKLYGL